MKPKKIKRRQFIANLLFTGGVLSVAALQNKLSATPIEEGWELPPDWNQGTPPPRPQPNPTRTPEPILEGDVAPPRFMGKVQPPKPPVPPPPDR